MTDYYKDKQQLTDEQIAELAPDWATHYGYACGDLVFVDCKACKIKESITKPIPRKKFDISEYEFSDKYATYTGCSASMVHIDVLNCGIPNGIFFDKDDVVAMAKHFNLTAEDL